MKKQFSKLLCGSLLALGLSAPVANAGSDLYIGEIMWVGFNFCPRGTMPAEGQLLPIAQNSALFSLLGTDYGGDGRTSFGLPDMRGRVSVSSGQGPGLSNYRQGTKLGQETINQVPAHTHTLGSSASATLKANGSTASLENNVAAPTGNMLANGQRAAIYAPAPALPAGVADMNAASVVVSGSTDSSGSSSVDVRQPTIALKACIATTGTYPPRN
jgi:microcystin-dependent protein